MKIIRLMMMTMLFMHVFTTPTNAQNNTTAADSIKTIQVKVKGITCGNDLKTIASNVEKLSGVSSCKTGKMGVTSSFEVKYNPAKINEKEIYTAIENTSGCENPNDRPYKVKH